ncbi:MAG: AraC family transcriptional regulator [Polyangiaceae bacterium]|nr:AraC family transcriptional regulator [Polyangiaceae bacterium]
MLQSTIGTVAPGIVSRTLSCAAELGVDPARLGRAPHTDRIAIARVYELWRALAKELGDPALPVRVAERAEIEDLDVLGLAMLTAPTARTAVRLFVQNSAMVTDSGAWEVHEATAQYPMSIVWRRGGSTLGERVSNETAILQAVGCLRRLVGDGFAPALVSFRHAAPPSLFAHEAFFRCPIRFHAEQDAVFVDRDVLDAVPPRSHRQMYAHFVEHVEQRHRAFRCAEAADSLLSRVRAAVATDPSDASMRRVARSLGMSDRTLRRRLREEGVSFRRTVDAVRRDRAAELLTHGETTVTSAALDLGFSDTSAFSHACRRWFGRSPSDMLARYTHYR